MQDLLQEAGTEIVALPSPMARAEDYRRRGRRSWTLGQKLAIVKEAEESDDPVELVARRHDMNANHLFMRMERAREGLLGTSCHQGASPRGDSRHLPDFARRSRAGAHISRHARWLLVHWAVEAIRH